MPWIAFISFMVDFYSRRLPETSEVILSEAACYLFLLLIGCRYKEGKGLLTSEVRLNQRIAQSVLGHSTPNLTAGAYTDVAALESSREMAKMPFLAGGMQIAAPSFSDSSNSLFIRGKNVAARHGFEP